MVGGVEGTTERRRFEDQPGLGKGLIRLRRPVGFFFPDILSPITGNVELCEDSFILHIKT
jgi:hypothetical protein